MTDLIMKAYDILDELKTDELYQNLKSTQKKIEQDYQKEIEAFNLIKIKYDEVLEQGGSYHPDYKETLKKLSEAKKNLYDKEAVKMYITLEKAFELKINTILKDISESISTHIKTPNELGLFKKEGGGCGVH